MRFGYYLFLTHEPKYNTLTWTLDYRYNSDFGTYFNGFEYMFTSNSYLDDNVGHWQLEPHPSRR